MTAHQLWLWVAHWGYPALFLGTLIEGTGLPGPVEILFFAAGFLVAQRRLLFLVVILVATIGSVVGNLIGYAVGRFGGRPFIDRYGRYMGLHSDGLGRAQGWFDRYGGFAVFISRLIGVTRTPAIVAAGVLKLRISSYVLWSLAADFIFSAFWAAIGTFFGHQWVAWRVRHPVIVYAGTVFIVVAMVGGIFISKYLMERILGPKGEEGTEKDPIH